MSPLVDRGGAGLLERDAELAALEQGLVDARAGAGRVMVIEAPAGLGKSALLAAAVARARGLGMTVLRAACAPLERDFAFGVVRQLFEPLRANLSPREWERLCAGAAAPARRALEDPPAEPAGADAPHAVLHGLYWLAVALAGRRSLLVAVDDAHAADRPSLRWLAHFSHRQVDLAALLVVTVRAGEPASDPDALAELLARAAEPPLRPAELGPSATALVVRARLHPAATADFCRACHHATAGNPLLLRALLDDLAAAGVTGTPGNAPPVEAFGLERVASAVTGRLRRLSPHALGLAQALSVLGDGARLGHAAALAGLALPAAARAADTARAAHVLSAGERLAFAHPVVQAALYRSIGPAQRALLHAAAARALAADGISADRRAPHLLRAEPTADPATVDTLQHAARTALARGAPEHAAALLRRALREPPTAERRPQLLLDLGLAAIATRAPDAPALLREALDTLPAGPDRARAALAAARALGSACHHTEAIDACHAALAATDGETTLLLEAELIANGLLHTPDTRARVQQPFAARTLAPRAGTAAEALWLANRALAATLVGDAPDTQAERALQALDSDLLDQHHDALPVLLAVLTLLWTDRLDQAADACGPLITAAEAHGHAGRRAATHALRAAINQRRGHPDAAERDARHALRLDRDTGAATPWTLTVLLDALIERDQADAAEQALADSRLPTDQPPELGYALLIEARARLHAAQQRPDAAVDDLHDAARRWYAHGITNPAIATWRGQLALQLAARQPDQARRLAAEQLDLARRTGLPATTATAIRHAALTDPEPEQRIAGLRAAAETLAATPARLQHAHALCDLGTQLRLAGHRKGARAPLQHALDLAHRAGATALATRAHHELLATGARPRRRPLAGPDALTASEQRVARLAADGLTNRQIAQTLYVTEHTVATHLHRTYQKLDIHSRAQLADALALARRDGD